MCTFIVLCTIILLYWLRDMFAYHGVPSGINLRSVATLFTLSLMEWI